MGAISSLLDLTRRSLNAQSQAIRTTGDNIANVSTPGYSRRKAELVTTQASGTENLRTGTGVEVNRIIRQVDQFLNSEYLDRIDQRAYAELRDQLLSRAEQPFKLEAGPGHIDFDMTEFFSALDDLAQSPSDLSLRTQVLQKGAALTQTINDTYNAVANLQREADTRIGDVVNKINTLSSQIADVNAQIRRGETTEQENLTLRDKRDQLLRDLAELVPINTLENSDGQVLVSLSSGFALVKGDESQSLSFSINPTFAPVGGYPVGLDGGGLHFVTYDFDQSTAGVSEADLTSVLASGGGEIGALLRMRGVQSATDTTPFDATGDLVDIASRVEVITRDLLTRFNQTYLGATDETPGGAFNPTSGGLDDVGAPYTPTPVYGLFTFSGAVDSNADGLPNDLAAIGLSNFASSIQFGVSTERELASALDLDATAGSLSFAPGDARNIQAVAALRNQTVNFGAYGVGSYAATTTLEGVYQDTVGFVGGLHAQAASDADVARGQEEQVKQLYEGVSGVNIDEEFASLINFQRAFEASARLVRTGDELLQEVINLLG